MEAITQNKQGSSRRAIQTEDNPQVQAIILAAGRGSRLETETTSLPKCLLNVGGKSLIQHQIDALKRNKIDEIIVVAGYLADEVEAAVGDQATLIRNDIWHKTEGLYSLSLCQSLVKDAIIIMNCDVLSHDKIIHRIVNAQGSAFAFDSITGTDDEHMKISLYEGKLKKMSKELDMKSSCGENVGLLFFEASAAVSLFKEIKHVIAENGHAFRLAVGVERVAQYSPLAAIDIADLPWIEIDYPEDLIQARRLIFPRLNLSSNHGYQLPM